MVESKSDAPSASEGVAGAAATAAAAGEANSSPKRVGCDLVALIRIGALGFSGEGASFTSTK